MLFVRKMYVTFDRKKVPSCTGCTILDKIKIVNIQQSQIFVFLLWYSHLTIYAWSIYQPTSLLLPNNVDVARFWDTQSSMQWYWYVHSTALLGVEPKIYGTEENIVKPVEFFAVKQDFFQNFIDTRIYLSSYLFWSKIV